MKRGLRNGLLAGIASLVFYSGAHAAGNDDAKSALAAMQALSIDIHAISREADRVRRDATTASATLDTRVGELRTRIDALRRSLPADAMDSSALAWKGRNLSLLLGNVERARKPGTTLARTSLIPEQRPWSARSTFTTLDAHHGARCEGALGFGVNGEVDGVIDAGGEIWLHLDVPAGRTVRVGTAASALDTRIDAYSDCTSRGGAPVADSDDTFGLAAVVGLRTEERPRSYWLRVRNLGARGELVVSAEDAGSIQGDINWQHVLPVNWEPQAIALDQYGWYVGSVSADASHYDLALAPGNYYVVASAYGNVMQIWPNIECIDDYTYHCPRESAQMAAVSASHATTGIDFTLNEGAHISGRVRDADGLASANATIAVIAQPSGAQITTLTDVAGRFSVKALAAGSYRVAASSPRYLMQYYDNVNCPLMEGCAPDAGTAITLARQGSFDHADFALQAAAHARAVVQANAAIPSIQVVVRTYTADGTQVATNYGNVGQSLEIGPLMPGNYRFVASGQNQTDQLYDHVDCISDCATELPTGALVSLDAGSTPTLGFDLHARATIRGRVTDSATGAGLADISLHLWPANGGWATSIYPSFDESGNFIIVGIAPGNYWLVAASPDHRDEAYPHAPCDDASPGYITACDMLTAQLITIGSIDVTGINFTLDKNAVVSGHVHHAGTAAPSPAPGMAVTLYDALSHPIRNAYSNDDGNWSIGDVPAGTYLAEAGGYYTYMQIYSGINCPLVGVPCVPASGTSIVLAQGQPHDGIDFNLIDTRRIAGRVTDAVSGLGVAGVAIDAWNAQSGQHCDAASTDAEGYYGLVDSGTCSGTTRAMSTDAGPGHVDQVFDGIACPNGSAYAGACALNGATAVAFPTMPTPVRVDFVLDRSDPIFANGFDAPSLRAIRRSR